MVHVRSVADCLPAADPAVCRSFSRRDRRAVAVPVPLGGTAQDRIRAPAGVARRRRVRHPRPVPRILAGQPRRLRRKHQSAEQHRAERLSALGRGQAGRHHGRCAREAGGNAQRGPLHRARARPPLPGHAGDRRLPRCRVRAARPAHRAQRGPGVADVVEGNSDRRTRRFRWPDRACRAVLAHLGSDFGADAHAAGRAARLRQPTHGTFVQPRCRRIPVHALQQLPQHRAEPDRAGKARPVVRPAAAARDGASRGRGALSSAVIRERALPRAGADQRPPDDPMRSSPLPRTLRR